MSNGYLTIMINYMDYKNILVTGAHGQLAQEIKEIINSSNTKHNYFFKAKEDLDILNKEEVKKFIYKEEIQLIINCAAYTNVDLAEENSNLADNVNNKAVANLVEISEKYEIFLIHISTDYVFGGELNQTPIKEDNQKGPTSVYGKSKLDGENNIVSSDLYYLILRTSWLYSSFGSNFVKKILELSNKKDELEVVIDQVGTPTYAKDLAKFIFEIIENEQIKNKKGIYHFSNEGVCSWYDLAVQIVKLSGNSVKVIPCSSDRYPSKVKRPAYSVLDKTKIKNDFEYEIPYWLDSLKVCLNKIKK